MFTNLAIVWGPHIVGLGDENGDLSDRLFETTPKAVSQALLDQRALSLRVRRRSGLDIEGTMARNQWCSRI